MQDETQKNTPEEPSATTWQDRICNGLTLVGLVAVVLIGGHAVLFGNTSDAQADTSLPAALPEAPAQPESAPLFEETSGAGPSMPEIIEEELPVDTAFIAQPDSLAPATPDSTAVTHPDTTGAHPAGTHATKHHPADSASGHHVSHDSIAG